MAASLILQMSDAARQVCATSGKGLIMNNDGVQQILRILRDHFAPDAADAIYKRACQTTDAFLLGSDVPLHTAVARVVMESGFPEEFVCILRMQNAPSPKNGKSVLASVRGPMMFPAAARQMRRLFGSCGRAARQDVRAVVDVDRYSEGESKHRARLAYRKA